MIRKSLGPESKPWGRINRKKLEVLLIALGWSQRTYALDAPNGKGSKIDTGGLCDRCKHQFSEVWVYRNGRKLCAECKKGTGIAIYPVEKWSELECRDSFLKARAQVLQRDEAWLRSLLPVEEGVLVKYNKRTRKTTVLPSHRGILTNKKRGPELLKRKIYNDAVRGVLQGVGQGAKQVAPLPVRKDYTR